jgi:hypothetical protein
VRSAYNILVAVPEGKKSLGRPRLSYKDNIRMDPREIWWDVDWMHVALDGDQWRALVKTVMNLRVL